jgi:rare lipoprotein A
MPPRITAIGALILLATALTGSAAKKQAASAKGASGSQTEKGVAAFYSRRMEGHKTACGGTYVASALTTAHRTLPCGTKLRITNTRNGKSIEATVNDRGPTSKKRIVDVSRAVAEQLDFVKQGTTTVEVVVVK